MMLSPPDAVHTAARRYCEEHADMWRGRYAELSKGRSASSPPEASLEGRRTYPRYKILDAILIEIERTPGGATSIEKTLTAIKTGAESALAAETRPPDLTLSREEMFDFDSMRKRLADFPKSAEIRVAAPGDEPSDDSVKREVMAEERDLLLAYLRGLDDTALADVEALPYRRTLTEAEVAGHWDRLKEVRSIDGQWYPLDRSRDQDPPAHTVAFVAKPFFTRELVELLWKILARLEVTRVFELRESGVSREIDANTLKPWYDFREGFWFDRSMTWLIYASHEGSVTIHGQQLLEILKTSWRDWEAWLYVESPAGIEQEVGPGVFSTSVVVEPPAGGSVRRKIYRWFGRNRSDED